MDIGTTRNLDFYLDDRNDMPLVEGRQQVERAISVAVMDAYYEEIGSLDSDNVIGLLERKARRVVKRTDYADDVVYVNGKFSEEEPNTVIMEISYESGELSKLKPLNNE